MATSISDQSQASQPSEAEQQEDASEMEQYLEDVTRTLESMVEWEQGLETLIDEANSHLKDEVERLRKSIGSGVERLGLLQRSLSKNIHGITDDETDVESVEIPVQFYRSIPELKFVPWKEASSEETPALEHFTIQIPEAQPSADDLNPFQERAWITNNDRRKELSSDSSKYKASKAPGPPKEFRRVFPGDSQDLEELPDRITIYSQRLLVFLGFNIGGPKLDWSCYSRSPMFILRPFQFLVFKGEDIRKALIELEHIRYHRLPQGEEAYDNEWKANDPEDSIAAEINPNEIDLSQLTALIKDLRCLTEFMDGYIRPTLEISRLDHIFFTDCWYCFPVGSLVYVKDSAVPQKIWKIIKSSGGHRYTAKPQGAQGEHADWYLRYVPFSIDCFHLDYDGTRYFPTRSTIQIEHFDGFQPILSLPALPIHVAEAKGLVDRQALIERGKEFVECTRPSHKQYVGRNQVLRPNGMNVHEKDAFVPENVARYAEWIESEVMVDFERALQEIPSWRPRSNESKFYSPSFDERDRLNGVQISGFWDCQISGRVIQAEMEKWQKWDKERTHPTKEEDILLLPERVFAFVFRTRKWGTPTI